ncbi:MAG: hypothetical protein AAGE80_17485 [Pseudomonadota bacterium]
MVLQSGASDVAAQDKELAEAAALELVLRQSNRGSAQVVESQLLNLFHREDTDGGGISESDYALTEEKNLAQQRTREIMNWLNHDLDGDGNVTGAELRRSQLPSARRPLRAESGLMFPPTEEQIAESLEALVDKTELPDPDGDGVSRLEEMHGAAVAKAKTQHRGRRRSIAQEFDLDGDGTITEAEFRSLIEPAILRADANADGIITRDEVAAARRAAKGELDNWRTVMRDRQRVENEQRRAESLRRTCGIRKASAGAEIILVGAREAQAVSSHHAGDADRVTFVADIEIAAGPQPVYLVAASANPLILRLSGAVERVERLTGLGQLVAVQGLPGERVNLSDPESCTIRTWPVSAQRNSALFALLDASFGRRPDRVIGHEALGQLTLPNGRHRQNRRLPDALDLEFDDEAKAYWNRFLRLHPGGLIGISPGTVVANDTLRPYRVWPRQAGLAQLLDADKITLLKPPTEGKRYKDGPIEFEGVTIYGGRGDTVIVDENVLTMGRDGAWRSSRLAVFEVLAPIRLPAGLSGKEGATFRLKPGVPRPTGQSRGVKIINAQ